MHKKPTRRNIKCYRKTLRLVRLLNTWTYINILQLHNYLNVFLFIFLFMLLRLQQFLLVLLKQYFSFHSSEKLLSYIALYSFQLRTLTRTPSFLSLLFFSSNVFYIIFSKQIFQYFQRTQETVQDYLCFRRLFEFTDLTSLFPFSRTFLLNYESTEFGEDV